GDRGPCSSLPAGQFRAVRPAIPADSAAPALAHVPPQRGRSSMASARRFALLAAPLLLALAVTTAKAAVNDACTASTEIDGDDFDEGVFLADATADAADPANACVAGAPEHTVWYRWTASETARVVVHTCGTSTDTTLAAFTGECDGLVPTGACSDDSPCGAGSMLDFVAVKGQEYVFELGIHPGAAADYAALHL